MVIARQCLFVSGAKQNYVKQANKAIVLVLSHSTVKEGHLETGGRVVGSIFGGDKIPSLWIHMLCTSPSCHSFVVRPIKTSQQYSQQSK